MSMREIDGFDIWSAATQFSDEQAIAYVSLKKRDGTGESRMFQIKTTCEFRSLDAAQSAARVVVNAVQRINSSGVPEPLDFQLK